MILPTQCFSRIYHVGSNAFLTALEDIVGTGSLTLEENVLRPNSTEWPIWHDDPWQNPQPRDGALPLRHDIALARYLEKQRACRASTIRRFDLWVSAIGLCALVARVGRPSSCARVLPSKRLSSGCREGDMGYLGR